MENYNFTSDNLSARGFISKESILEIVSQEDIFRMVFKEIPESFTYLLSPFRKDTNPSCWFDYHIDGKLRFTDFGNSNKVNGISMKNIDCFDAVQVYFGLPDFYATLNYIHITLIKGKPQTKKSVVQPTDKVVRLAKILVEPRLFQIRDKDFWYKGYGITKNQLIEDKISAVSRFHFLNTKKGNISSQCLDIAYSFNDFPFGRKKLYFPHRLKNNRFLTTCTKEDIGGINSLASYGKKLVITKSYKDWRVLKNQGKHVVWFQNEGMFPESKTLLQLIQRFEKVVVFFDNDPPGIQASQTLTAILNSLVPQKAISFWLPELLLEQKITDPSDFYFCKGKTELNLLLKHFTI